MPEKRPVEQGAICCADESNAVDMKVTGIVRGGRRALNIELARRLILAETANTAHLSVLVVILFLLLGRRSRSCLF